MFAKYSKNAALASILLLICELQICFFPYTLTRAKKHKPPMYNASVTPASRLCSITLIFEKQH